VQLNKKPKNYRIFCFVAVHGKPCYEVLDEIPHEHCDRAKHFSTMVNYEPREISRFYSKIKIKWTVLSLEQGLTIFLLFVSFSFILSHMRTPLQYRVYCR